MRAKEGGNCLGRKISNAIVWMENSVQSWHRRSVFLPSLDHFIRSIQQRLRNAEIDLLRCFQIDHQLKLRGLLDRQIGGLGSLQDSVHVICDTPVPAPRAGPEVRN